MFGIGIFELIFVFFIALIVLGPKQLPEVARQIGVWYYRLKKAAQTAQAEMEETFHEIEEEALKQDQGGKSQDHAEKKQGKRQD